MAIRDYYLLIKPGIIRGNLLAVIAGFILASQNSFHVGEFIGVILGSSLIMASGCVINNILDRDIDKYMERTAKRATVTGTISARNAIIYAVILGLGGLVILLSLTNTLTALIGLTGLILYAAVYTPLKPRSLIATPIGALAGAIPPVAGYTATTGTLDTAAYLLFAALALWQLPHFYAIGIYRADQYRKADVPLLQDKIGQRWTRLVIQICIILFAIICLLFYFLGVSSLGFALLMLGVSSWWLLSTTNGKKNDTEGAKSLFLRSLIVLLSFCFLLSADAIL